MNDHNHDTLELTRSRPARPGHGTLWATTVLAVILVGAAALWLAGPEDWRNAVTASLRELSRHTPLESLFTSPPPELPATVRAPATAPGTLSGPVVAAPVPLPADPGVRPDLVDPDAVAMAPRVREDKVVQPLFVEDLARWMVSRYRPGQGGPGVQAANLRYASRPRGIRLDAADVVAGRDALLRYAFQPTMLRALYDIYVDRFLEQMAAAAGERRRSGNLTDSQIRDMYRAYAARCAALAGVLEGVAALPDLPARLETVETTAHAALALHSQLAETAFARDQARQEGRQADMDAMEGRLTALNRVYGEAMARRNAAQQALVEAVRRHAAGAGEDSILFVANWMRRRQAQHPQAREALAAGGHILRDLSARLDQAGQARP